MLCRFFCSIALLRQNTDIIVFALSIFISIPSVFSFPRTVLRALFFLVLSGVGHKNGSDWINFTRIMRRYTIRLYLRASSEPSKTAHPLLLLRVRPYARGVADNKGSILAVACAAADLLRARKFGSTLPRGGRGSDWKWWFTVCRADTQGAWTPVEGGASGLAP